VKTVRKQILFSADLAERIQHMCASLKEDFSSFVRAAAEARLKAIERERLARELAEGYAANAELDASTCEDFKFVDEEGA